MSRSLKFARALAARLRYASVQYVPEEHYLVLGRLDTGVVIVRVEIRVARLFEVLKRNRPSVLCKEKWMREGADWHNWQDAGMCWVLPHLWCDAMCWRGKPIRAIMEEGQTWLMNDVTSLINRHYLAHLEERIEWPAEWEAWGHGKAGVQEYEDEKRSSRSNSGTWNKTRRAI